MSLLVWFRAHTYGGAPPEIYTVDLEASHVDAIELNASHIDTIDFDATWVEDPVEV